MFEFVLLGRSATIRVRHRRTVPATEAALTIYRFSKTGVRAVLKTDTIRLVEGAGVYEWPSTGIEKDEMSFEAFWEVKVEGKAAGKGEVIVYRDRIQVLVLDANPPGAPMPRAHSRFTSRGDAGWSKQTRFVGALDATVDQRSAHDGMLDFPGVVYGRHEIEFRPPFFLREWRVEGEYTTTGPMRKALVEKRYRARLVSPRPPGNGARRQWVNLDPVGVGDGKEAAEKGSALRLTLRVNEEDGGGLTGDKIWVRATYEAGNSPRTGDPRPTFGGDPVQPGQSYLKDFTLLGDGGTVDVVLELGLAGGDKVTILVAGHAGVSNDAHDEKLVIENWRRVWLQPVAPTGVAALHLPDAMGALAKTALEQAFIELVIPAVSLRLDPPGSVGCHEVTGALATNMGLPADSRNVVYSFNNAGVDSDVAKRFSAAYDNSGSCPAYPPTLFVVLGQNVLVKGAVQPFKFTVKGRATKTLVSPGGFFVLRDWAGTDSVGALANGEPSYWKVGNVKTPVTHQYLTVIDKSFCSVTFAIPEDAPGRPSYFSRDNVEVELRVRLFGSVAGSSSGRWLCFWYNSASDMQKAGYALIHEIGHCLNQAALAVSARGLGPAAKNMLAYAYEGSHCSTGVSGLNRVDTMETTYGTSLATGRMEASQTPRAWARGIDWMAELAAGRQGSCVMFSPVGPNTKYPAQPTFCAPCVEYLKATDLRRTPPP